MTAGVCPELASVVESTRMEQQNNASRPILFVDMFCGTKSVANAAIIAAKALDVVIDVITVDSDPGCDPTVVCKIGNRLDEEELRALLNERTQDKPLVLFHMSPPCTDFSVANPNRPAVPTEALRIVKAAIAIADEYAHAWVLENPQGGSLWNDTIVPRRLDALRDHRRDVSYCMYGALYRKNTRLAFCGPVPASFAALYCRGNTCQACHSGRHVQTVPDLPLNERISMPKQLCVQMVITLYNMAHRPAKGKNQKRLSKGSQVDIVYEHDEAPKLRRWTLTLSSKPRFTRLKETGEWVLAANVSWYESDEDGKRRRCEECRAFCEDDYGRQGAGGWWFPGDGCDDTCTLTKEA